MNRVALLNVSKTKRNYRVLERLCKFSEIGIT